MHRQSAEEGVDLEETPRPARVQGDGERSDHARAVQLSSSLVRHRYGAVQMYGARAQLGAGNPRSVEGTATLAGPDSRDLARFDPSRQSHERLDPAGIEDMLEALEVGIKGLGDIAAPEREVPGESIDTFSKRKGEYDRLDRRAGALDDPYGAMSNRGQGRETPDVGAAFGMPRGGKDLKPLPSRPSGNQADPRSSAGGGSEGQTERVTGYFAARREALLQSLDDRLRKQAEEKHLSEAQILTEVNAGAADQSIGDDHEAVIRRLKYEEAYNSTAAQIERTVRRAVEGIIAAIKKLLGITTPNPEARARVAHSSEEVIAELQAFRDSFIDPAEEGGGRRDPSRVVRAFADFKARLGPYILTDDAGSPPPTGTITASGSGDPGTLIDRGKEEAGVHGGGSPRPV